MENNTSPIQIIGAVELTHGFGIPIMIDAKDTYEILINEHLWSEDHRFYTTNQSYTIEDLIGKKVQVGPFIFTVVEN